MAFISMQQGNQFEEFFQILNKMVQCLLFLRTNDMSYISDVTSPNEPVIAEARIHWFIYAKGFFFLTIGVAILFSVNSAILLLSIPAILYGFLSLISAAITRTTTEFAVTTKRVIAKSGLIKRDTIEVSNSKVESIRVDQTILGRIMGYGTVAIVGSGGSYAPLYFIADPIAFRSKVLTEIDK